MKFLKISSCDIRHCVRSASDVQPICCERSYSACFDDMERKKRENHNEEGLKVKMSRILASMIFCFMKTQGCGKTFSG